jgi:hypothetical protein
VSTPATDAFLACAFDVLRRISVPNFLGQGGVRGYMTRGDDELGNIRFVGVGVHHCRNVASKGDAPPFIYIPTIDPIGDTT